MTFRIEERLPSLNDVIDANRYNKYKGAALKKKIDNTVIYYIIKASVNGDIKPITEPCIISIEWYE